MQFIEQFFGISPDGGSGALEGSLVFLFIVLLTFVGRLLRRAGRNRAI